MDSKLIDKTVLGLCKIVGDLEQARIDDCISGGTEKRISNDIRSIIGELESHPTNIITPEVLENITLNGLAKLNDWNSKDMCPEEVWQSMEIVTKAVLIAAGWEDAI